MGSIETRMQIVNLRPGLANSDECLSRLAQETDQTNAQTCEPGPVLLLGAPGVGKGTQADNLAKMWEVPKISTGEILRANVASGTALGAEANRIMKRGALVPDQIMNEMIANRLSIADTAKGFILDGFPRTVRQAEWLDRQLCAHQNGACLGIISMRMDVQQIVERVINRRFCPLCKAVYNTRFLPPKRTGRCDKDGSVLEQRADDTLEVFQKRIDVFKRETEPLIQYYRSHSPIIEVDADRPPSLVTRDIVGGLINFRKASGHSEAIPKL